jgi:hypothetical protein
MSRNSALLFERLIDAKPLLKKLQRFSCSYLIRAKLFLLMLIVIAAFAYSTSKANATEATPSISPSYQVFSSGPQSVSITDTDGSAVLHFTTDGTAPTSSSPTYTSSFNVSSTTTVQAIAIGSGGTSAVATSIVQIDASTATLPRTNLVLWHKADNGAITSGGNVTSWIDVSGGGYTTTGVNGNVPLVTNAINGLPALSFSASQYFAWPSGFSTIGPGASIFVVCKPTSTASSAVTSIGNGGASDALDLWEATGGGISLYANNGGTQSVVTASGALNINSFQILEGIHSGTGTATLFKTGTQIAQNTSMQNLNNVTRSDSYIGAYNTPGYFSGQIAEILVYSTPLSVANRQAVEKYLWTRYVNAPTISPNIGVFSSTQTITLTGSGLGAVRYTLDGSIPGPTSTLYAVPFSISASATVNAVEIYNGAQSATATAYFQLDPSTANIPRSGLLTWQKSDFGLTISGSSVTNWADASGNAYNMSTVSGDTSPTYHASAVNGLPAVTFDGVANGFMWPSGFSDLTAGCSIFINYHPIGRSSGYIMSLAASGGNNVALFPYWNGGQPLGFMVNSYAPAFWSTFYLGQYQNLSLILNGTTGSYYINGQMINQSTSLTSLANVLRNQNYIGGAGYGTYFAGDYTEVLIYSRAVTATEFANISSYLATRYLGPTASAPVAPVFNLAAGTLTAPTELGISTAPGAVTHFTVDGTTPSATSPVLTSAVQINYSQTVQAISIQNGLSSSVTSAAYTLDNTKYPAPSASDPSTLQINLQSPSPAQ